MPYTSEPEVVEQTIHDLLKDDDPEIQGQAMVSLDVLELDGHIALQSDYTKTLKEKITSQDAPLSTRISAMAILGRRNTVEEKAFVRRLATEPSDIQRVAIATLGLIGDSTDAALLEEFELSEDRIVALAAKSALKRLKEK